MSFHVDGERLEAARVATLRRLTSSVNGQGIWVGELSGSPLATAVAVSALALAEQHVDDQPRAGTPGHENWLSGVLIREELTQLLMNSLRWLANHQNADGGWGDAAGGPSNLPATMAVRAALQLTGVPAKYAGLAERAEAYMDAHGGAAGLRERCAEEPMLAPAVLTNYALADLIPWRQAPALAFEIFCLPRRWRERYLGAGPSFAGVVFGALGAARFHHAKPRNPLVRLVRRAGVRPCLAALADMQPPSGGFLASTVATSFVVMSLASVGLGDKQVVRRGVEFLLATARPDGSWPVEADRAVWNTSQAVALLDIAEASCGDEPAARQKATERAVDWLVARQQNEKLPGVRLACGGWSASGWDGGPASASVTAAALTALAASHRKRSRKRQEEVYQVVLSGLEWLLALEHDEGGWSEYRGERWATAGRGAEVTAEVLRGLEACQRELRLAAVDAPMARRVRAAISRGVAHLVSVQGPEGSWGATWFGNHLQAEPRNHVYATAQALMTFAELGMKAEDMAEGGARWLAGAQDASGGWGPVGPLAAPAAVKKGTDAAHPLCSVEETAAAVGALLPYRRVDPKIEHAMESGLAWLCEAVLREPAPEPADIGLSFERFWYAERLAGTLLTGRALVAASAELSRSPSAPAATAEVHA